MLNIAAIKTHFFSNPKILSSQNIFGQEIQILICVMSKLIWDIGHQGHLLKFLRSRNNVHNRCSEAVRVMGEGA